MKNIQRKELQEFLEQEEFEFKELEKEGYKPEKYKYYELLLLREICDILNNILTKDRGKFD